MPTDYIILPRKLEGETNKHFPLGTIWQWREEWGPIPEGWIEMPMGGEIPEEYPELRELFRQNGFDRFPDFRGRVVAE